MRPILSDNPVTRVATYNDSSLEVRFTELYYEMQPLHKEHIFFVLLLYMKEQYNYL